MEQAEDTESRRKGGKSERGKGRWKRHERKAKRRKREKERFLRYHCQSSPGDLFFFHISIHTLKQTETDKKHYHIYIHTTAGVEPSRPSRQASTGPVSSWSSRNGSAAIITGSTVASGTPEGWASIMRATELTALSAARRFEVCEREREKESV